MHVLSCMIDSTCPPIHLDFYEQMKARSRREHTSYSTKQIFYICWWLCTQKNTRQFTSQEIQNIQRDREAQRLTQAKEKEELVAKKKEELDVEQLRAAWQSIWGAGFKFLHEDIQMTEVYHCTWIEIWCAWNSWGLLKLISFFVVNILASGVYVSRTRSLLMSVRTWTREEFFPFTGDVGVWKSSLLDHDEVLPVSMVVITRSHIPNTELPHFLGFNTAFPYSDWT